MKRAWIATGVIVVLLLLAVGAGPSLIYLTALGFVIVFCAGVAMVIFHPRRGLKWIAWAGGILLAVGLIGPAIVSWLRLAFGHS